MIDYFHTTSDEIACLLRIKGNYRREFVGKAIKSDGLDSVPHAWAEHEISETLKAMLQRQHPRARGGEDLPDLNENEVEIARFTLVDSVHGEVTSLRAQKVLESRINYRMVDEYETDIKIPYKFSSTPLTEKQALDCEIELQSYFYSDLAVDLLNECYLK